ncbi:hypothetical protein ZWY2020_059575 [Hordeum vulgare]|nr:hypothetical protein ZWY2020_059575 [Hordeum vulgare]
MREPNLGTWPLPPGPQTSYCCHAAGRLSLHLQQAHGSATIASIPSLSLGSFHPNSVWLDQLAPPSRKSRTSTRRAEPRLAWLAAAAGGAARRRAGARAPPAGGGGHTTAGSAAPSRETAERSSLASLESEVQAYNSIHIHFLMRFLLAGTQQNDVGLTGYNSLQNFSSKSNVNSNNSCRCLLRNNAKRRTANKDTVQEKHLCTNHENISGSSFRKGGCLADSASSCAR